MKPNIRIEEYKVAADTVSIGGIRWLTKWDVKVQFSDHATAIAWKERIGQMLQGEALAQPEPWTPEDMAYRPGGLAQSDQDQTEIAFEAWWQAHGQYCRAGGGDYEKTFAYRAWMASLATPEKPEHPEQMARLGWQYVECPACGSEGARAFPKPEQEPVACPYCHNSHTLGAVYFDQNCAGCVKRMTTPPRREWVGLTDEEIGDQYVRFEVQGGFNRFDYAVRTLEAKLKGKNS